MFMGKQSKNSMHPYAWLAIFSLAAAGVISITKKGSEFITEKAGCIKGMMKSKAKEVENAITNGIDDMMN